MKMRCYGFFLAGLVLLVSGCVSSRSTMADLEPAISADACAADDGGIELPEGFCAVVVADTLGRLRHITVSESGDIYVIHRELRPDGGITALRDTDRDGKADVVRTFGQIAGTGIELRGDYLYFSDNETVYRYRMTPGDLVPPSQPEVVAGEFLEQRSHAAKAFAFDGSGNLFVNVGAPSNACQEQDRTAGSPAQDPCPLLERQSGIWRFDAGETGLDQTQDGRRFATGIRNVVAIDWNPVTRRMYVVQHGRDMLHQLFPELYTAEEGAELPSEEMFVLQERGNYGWPYCYYDHRQDRKVLAPEYGGDGESVGRCEDALDPIYAFPGHYAPNDLAFYTSSQFPARYRNGAFIAFHGSWNRAPLPQQGYLVAFLPFDGGGPAGEWEVFADGFKGKDVLENPSDAVYRPMGLAVGPDGSLFVTDSMKGRIWRIIYTGE